MFTYKRFKIKCANILNFNQFTDQLLPYLHIFLHVTQYLLISTNYISHNIYLVKMKNLNNLLGDSIKRKFQAMKKSGQARNRISTKYKKNKMRFRKVEIPTRLFGVLSVPKEDLLI